MIITIAHQKGGTGKSTLATNIATLLQADILDLDKQHSSALWNYVRSLPKEKGGAGKAPLRMATLAISGCSLPAQTPIDTIDFQSYLNAYAENTDHILVIDTAGFDSGNNRLSLIMADMIITPVAPSQMDLYGLNQFRSIVQEAEEHVHRKLNSYVVLNNVVESSKKTWQDATDYITSDPTFKLLHTKIHRRIDYQRAYEHGLSVVELAATKKAAKEMKELADEIKAIIEDIRK